MNNEAEAYLKEYSSLWELVPDGDPFYTHSSLLQPVLFDGIPAVIKISVDEEEKRGAAVMLWWEGRGAAKVLKKGSSGLLLERAAGDISLADMSAGGTDDEASLILCQVAAKLHAHEKKHLPSLVPLNGWFKDLMPAAEKYGAVLRMCSEIARELLDSENSIVVLHGDLHHKNVLHSLREGWIAIDPKGLIGERTFDYANIFCNPDSQTALAPGRLSRQIKVISEAAGLDAERLLKWVAAWAGLSASWLSNEGHDAELSLQIAELAVEELKK